MVIVMVLAVGEPVGKVASDWMVVAISNCRRRYFGLSNMVDLVNR